MRKVPMFIVTDLAHGLRAGEKIRSLAKRLGIARNTVKNYRDRLEERGLLEPSVPMPDGAVLASLIPAPDPSLYQKSTVEPYRELVEKLIKGDCRYTTIWLRLKERGFTGEYSAVKRYCRRHFAKPVEVYCRMESKPGERAHVDFGSAGMVRDPRSGRLRQAWFFLMTLAWSRHMFLRFVFDQTVPTFLACIESAFRRFGGVPGELVTDNLSLNRRGDEWTMTTAGMRVHGTTKEIPLERFERTERAALKPLPEARFEIPVAYRPKVARDGRVTVDNRRYTVPPKYVGMTLEAYDNGRVVEIFHDFVPVAMHERAEKPGEERCRDEHLPEHKREVVGMTPARCREEAGKVGASCRAVIDRMLDDPEQNRLSAARCLLRLGRTHGAARLEEACRRLLLVDDVNYRRAKTMLRGGLDLIPFEASPPAPPADRRSYRYARPASCFFGEAVTGS